MQITDGILKDFKAGDIDVFYTEIYPSLLTYAIRFLGTDYSFLAEDCVQDAIFTAYGQRTMFLTPMQFKSFIYSCVRNNAVSVLRKNHSRDNYISQNHETDYDLSNAIIEQETLDLLYAAINRLPEDMKRIFELSFERGLKNAEVAAELGISESMVKKRKMKMIAILRESFAGDAALQLLIILYFFNALNVQEVF